MHLHAHVTKGDQGSSSDNPDSNFLICCFFRLYNSSLLNAVCLIDMIFFLITLSFNLVWALLEIFGKSKSVDTNSLIMELGYGLIMFGNVLVLIYAIHFKVNFRRYNMLVKNWYFKGYYYMRITWGIIGSILAITILIYLNFYAQKTQNQNNPESKRFLRISNMFSILYIVYSAFCLSSSKGFRLSWYGMLSKDIDFYFS